MSEINLLPTQLKVGKNASKASSILSKFSVVLLIILILVGLSAGGYLYYLSGQAKDLTDRQQQLQSSITAIQGSSDNVLLIKDRTTKLSSILSSRVQFDVLEKYDAIISSLSSNARLSKIELESGIYKLTLVFGDSKELANLLSSIAQEDQYSYVYIESLNYSPSYGYELVLDLN